MCTNKKTPPSYWKLKFCKHRVVSYWSENSNWKEYCNLATECVFHIRYWKDLLKSFVSDHKKWSSHYQKKKKKDWAKNCSCFTLFIFKGLWSHHKVLASVFYFCFAIRLTPEGPLWYQECFYTNYTNGSGKVEGTMVAFNTVTFKIFSIKKYI